MADYTNSALDDFLSLALFSIGIIEVCRESHNDGYDDVVGSNLAVSLRTSEAA